jgi:hypothetical protein
VAQWYHQALASLFVASYDLQDYGGGIRTRLHTGSITVRESESALLYDWRFTANHFVLVTSPLRLRARFFFQLNTCGHSPYVTSSVTRGWVCCLQLPLAFASTFILRSKSHRTHDHILLSQIHDPPPQPGAQISIFITPGTGGPSYIHQHWVPFPSPFMTRRATVEVIRIILHTLEGQSAMPWCINSRWTEYET